MDDITCEEYDEMKKVSHEDWIKWQRQLYIWRWVMYIFVVTAPIWFFGFFFLLYIFGGTK